MNDTVDVDDSNASYLFAMNYTVNLSQENIRYVATYVNVGAILLFDGVAPRLKLFNFELCEDN